MVTVHVVCHSPKIVKLNLGIVLGSGMETEWWLALI
jgi:hypothetical protein